MSSDRDIWNSIKTTDIQEDYENTLLYSIRDTFNDNLYREQVYKNYDTTTLYNVIISEGDKDSDIVGVKKLWSYPYDTVQFSTGDYIRWNGSTWMIISLDSERIYEVYGEILECTQILKRYNNDGKIISKLAPFYAIKGGGETEDKDFSTGTAVRYANVPYDSDTVEWIENYRINEKPVLFYISNEDSIYRLVYADVSSSDTMCKLTFNLEAMSRSMVDFDLNIIKQDTSNTFTLSIDQSDIDIQTSDTSQLSATVKDDNNIIVTKTLAWSSDDELIVSVDDNGLITAEGVGTATITCAMADNTDVYDTIDITVSAVVSDEYQIILSPSNTIVSVGNYSSYTVSLINNGQLIVGETFTIDIGGETLINNDNYHFEQYNSTQFWIQNKYGHDEMMININVTGNTTLYSSVITLTLKA